MTTGRTYWLIAPTDGASSITIGEVEIDADPDVAKSKAGRHGRPLAVYGNKEQSAGRLGIASGWVSCPLAGGSEHLAFAVCSVGSEEGIRVFGPLSAADPDQALDDVDPAFLAERLWTSWITHGPITARIFALVEFDPSIRALRWWAMTPQGPGGPLDRSPLRSAP